MKTQENKTKDENIMKDYDKPYFVHHQQHIQQKQQGTSSILSKLPSMMPSSASPMSVLLRK